MTDSRVVEAVPLDQLDMPTLPPVGPNNPDRLKIYAEARAQSWIAKSPSGYTILRYDDVVAIHRDKRFINGINQLLRRSGITDEQFLARRPNPFLRSEGEDHARLRRLVAPAFSARGADKLRGFMRDELTLFAREVRSRGRADLATECFDKFPIAVICELLGAPREDWQRFFDWTSTIFEVYGVSAGQRMDAILQAHRELDEYIEAMIDARRSRPADDLLTSLIVAEEGGDRLSTEEMQSVVEAIMLAGTDTTRNQLGITFITLMRRPEQLEILRRDPSLIPGAVEESLRYLATSGGQSRYVPEDAEYKGVLFPAGTLFFTNFVSANFDPAIWGDDAEDFDVTRKKQGNGQLTFGIGRHVCLGASIARFELEEALRVLLTELPGLRLEGEIAARAGGDSSGMWGFDSIPVTFDKE